MTDKNRDGKVLAERVKGSLTSLVNLATDDEWQRLYEILKEWQLLPIVLLFLEGLEDGTDDIHG